MNKRTIQSILMMAVLALLVTFSNSCKKDDGGSDDGGGGGGGDGGTISRTYLSAAKVKGTHREGLTGCPQLLGAVSISNHKVGSSEITADSFAITSNYNGVVLKVDDLDKKGASLTKAHKIFVYFDCTVQGALDYQNLITLYKNGKEVHEDKLRSEVLYIK